MVAGDAALGLDLSKKQSAVLRRDDIRQIQLSLESESRKALLKTHCQQDEVDNVSRTNTWIAEILIRGHRETSQSADNARRLQGNQDERKGKIRDGQYSANGRKALWI